eukprot:TRINITY_DN109148_c0_g1_i2.p1 TRINITY_DN109148_c0_g1~~TRINITY_DN109148_c0_g1_i2.p1  ORF type:complete len:491 (-),score=103.81 TRINITY_DN109148_c0_g1_i2:50-1522(-)
MARVGLAAAAVAFIVALVEGRDIADLQGDVKEEQRRINIAEFVIQSATKDASQLVEKQRAAEASLAKSERRVHEAQVAGAKAKLQVQELEAKLGATKEQLASTEAQRKSALAAAQQEEASANKAERQAASEHSRAEAVLPQRNSVIFEGIALLTQHLKEFESQNLVAAVAGLAGVASLWDSRIFLQVLSVSLVALGAGAAGSDQFLAAFVSSPPRWLAIVSGAEVAAVTAAAAVIGFSGFQLLIGAVLGLLIAHLSVGWAATWCHGQDALWYLALLALGSLATGLGGDHAGAAIGALAGGLLAASSVGFLFAELLSGSELPPSWVDAVDAIVRGTGQSESLGEEASLVRILALLVWAGMTAYGVYRWCRSQMKGREESFDSLRLPLLEPKSTEAPQDVAEEAQAPAPAPALATAAPQQPPTSPSKQSLFPKGLGSNLFPLPSPFKSSRTTSDQGSRSSAGASQAPKLSPRKQAAPPPPNQRKGRDPYDIY